jgi:hypothetical protein
MSLCRSPCLWELVARLPNHCGGRATAGEVSSRPWPNDLRGLWFGAQGPRRNARDGSVFYLDLTSTIHLPFILSTQDPPGFLSHLVDGNQFAVGGQRRPNPGLPAMPCSQTAFPMCRCRRRCGENVQIEWSLRSLISNMSRAFLMRCVSDLTGWSAMAGVDASQDLFYR